MWTLHEQLRPTCCKTNACATHPHLPRCGRRAPPAAPPPLSTWSCRRRAPTQTFTSRWEAPLVSEGGWWLVKLLRGRRTAALGCTAATGCVVHVPALACNHPRCFSFPAAPRQFHAALPPQPHLSPCSLAALPIGAARPGAGAAHATQPGHLCGVGSLRTLRRRLPARPLRGRAAAGDWARWGELRGERVGGCRAWAGCEVGLECERQSHWVRLLGVCDRMVRFRATVATTRCHCNTGSCPPLQATR